MVPCLCVTEAAILNGNSGLAVESWADMSECPGPAVGINLRTREGVDGVGVGVGAKQVQLQCPNGETRTSGFEEGNLLTPPPCPHFAVIVGFRLRVDPQSDVIGISGKCSDGSSVTPYDAGEQGAWTEWARCPSGMAVAGVQTGVLPMGNSLSDVRMICRPTGMPLGMSAWQAGEGARGGGVGTRPRYLIVCLWRRLLASRHCSSDCLPLAAPIGLSPLLILTLCGPERVLVVSTEPLDDLSCLTTPGVGCPGDGLLPVPLTRGIPMHTPSPCGGLPTPALT